MELLSYTHGASKTKFWYCTIPDLLDLQADEIPDVDAYVFRTPGNLEKGPDKRYVISFRDLKARSDQIAIGLLRIGLKPGDRVAVMGPYCVEWVCMDYAILKTNMLMIRLSDQLTPDDLKQMLGKYKCKAFAFHPGDGQQFLLTLRENFPEIVASDAEIFEEIGLPYLKYVISMTDETSHQLLCLQKLLCDPITEEEQLSLQTIQQSIKCDDKATCFMTSGSTGIPKCVVHSHFSVVENHRVASLLLGIKEPGVSRYFTDRALTWSAAMPYIPAVSGATLVNINPKYTIEGGNNKFVFDVLNEEKISCSVSMAYLAYDLTSGIEKKEFYLPETFTHLFMVGETMSPTLLHCIAKYIPHVVFAYGSTETQITLITFIDTHNSDGSLAGGPARHAEIRITDDDGHTLKIGEQGNLIIRSPLSFMQYLQDLDTTTAKLDESRWFNTEDCGTMLPDGRVVVLGRRRDIISRAAVKIYPIVIETVLIQHPKVKKVCVVGVPDERLFDEVCACVIAVDGDRPHVDELEALCKKGFIATGSFDFTPKYVVFFEAFPINNGKVDRRSLKFSAAAHIEETNKNKTSE